MKTISISPRKTSKLFRNLRENSLPRSLEEWTNDTKDTIEQKAKGTKNIYLRQAIRVDIQFNLSSAKYWEFIHQLWFCDMLGAYYVESAVICFVMKTKHSNMTSHTEGAKIWANCFQLQNKKALVNLWELLNNALALFFSFPTQNKWVNCISVHAHWRPIITTLLITTSIFRAAKENVWEQLLKKILSYKQAHLRQIQKQSWESTKIVAKHGKVPYRWQARGSM